MKKRLLCLLLSGFIALTGLFAVPLDTYAVPGEGEASVGVPDEGSGETGEGNGGTGGGEGSAGGETGSGAAAEEDVDGEEGAAADGSGAEGDSGAGGTTDVAEEEGQTCYDQVGMIGWLVCSTSDFLARAIDGLYGIIQDLLRVNPVSTDQESPFYLVWEWMRNLTNIVFVILMLVVVCSQLTGFGLNNYGVKKVLPRVVIVAIAVNLSFIVCALAVDVSNVLGAGLGGVLTSIREAAMANGTIDGGGNISVVQALGMGAAGAALGAGAVVGGVAAVGGLPAAFFALLPVVLSGAVAVIAAFLTLAARQALVLLLIMVAPLAFVAYLLPNTEKWFKQWKDLFMKMLIFYPMFSVLFGGAQLAGWVILSAATNALGVILGIAVQLLPLFAAWPLMKMSGTVLGKVNEYARRPFAPAQKAFGAWADSQRQKAKQQYLAGNARGYQLSRRLAQGLADRRVRREEDTAIYSARAKERGQAFASSSVYRSNSWLNRRRGIAGTLTARGERLYGLQDDELRNKNAVMKVAADFDEGIGVRADDARVRNGSRRHLQRVNDRLVAAVDTSHFQTARAESIKLDNLESHARRVEGARELAALRMRVDRTLDEDVQLAELESDANNSLRLREIEATAGDLGKKGINNMIASAIAMKTKADSEAKGNYNALFEQTARTREIDDRFNQALIDGNYNEMEAAIGNLAVRGDFDLIVKGLLKNGTAENMSLGMQKHLADTLIRYKADSAPLATYAKALNVRRGKAAAGQPINEFISFESFANGTPVPGDSGDIASGLTLSALLGDIADPAVATTQDRNTFDFLLDLAMNGGLRIDPNNPETALGFKLKQLRSAASSGRMDGEQLGNLNSLLTGGIASLKDPKKLNMSDPTIGKQLKKRAEIGQFANQNSGIIKSNVETYLSKMSASQLANMKESTFDGLNQTLKYLAGKSDAEIYDKENIDSQMFTYLNTAITGIKRPSAAAMKGSMNTEIGRKLNIN